MSVVKRHLVTAAFLALLGWTSAGIEEPPLTPAGTSAPGSFALSGTVDGLFPGGARSLRVRVTNPHAFAIRVTAIDVIAADASSACRAGQLVPTGFRGAMVVPARGQRTVDLPIRLRREAPDTCQGASFPLKYQGTAVRSP